MGSGAASSEAVDAEADARGEASDETAARAALGAVTHDLNNLLTCILACASMADRPGDDAGVQRSLRAIREAVHQAVTLLARLHEPGGGSAGPGGPCRVDELLDWTGLLLDRVGQRSRVAVSVQSGACHAAIAAVELQQILINLGLNAIEAMPRGGRLSLAALAVDAEVVLTVADDGPGITPEWQARMFDWGATTKQEREHGLGLALVKRLVDRCGGRITVASQASRGTVFTLHLPRAATP